MGNSQEDLLGRIEMTDCSWLIPIEKVTIGLSLPGLLGERFHKLKRSRYLAHVAV